MTKPEDVFPALSGLAHEFSIATGDVYVAGIRKGDLIRSFNWRRWPAKEARRPEEYLAPSWSWAAFTSKSVRVAPGLNLPTGSVDITELAAVVDVDTRPATADKYGRLEY